MSALGRLPPLGSGHFRLFECPLSVKADIQPGRVSAYRPKAAILGDWAKMAANNPRQPVAAAGSISRNSPFTIEVARCLVVSGKIFWRQ